MANQSSLRRLLQEQPVTAEEGRQILLGYKEVQASLPAPFLGPIFNLREERLFSQMQEAASRMIAMKSFSQVERVSQTDRLRHKSLPFGGRGSCRPSSQYSNGGWGV